jgi:ankyrin repeat protein
VDGEMVRSLSDDVFSDAVLPKENSPAAAGTLAKSDSVASSLSTISTLTLSTGDADGSLVCAARDFDIKAIKDLLKSEDISANQTSRKGYTALHEMIKCYSNMNIVDKMSNRKHLEEVIIALREKGLDVNAVDHGKKKQTALHIIAEYDGNEDVIKILIAVGMRVNLVNGAGETALHKAVGQVGDLTISTSFYFPSLHLPPIPSQCSSNTMREP